MSKKQTHGFPRCTHFDDSDASLRRALQAGNRGDSVPRCARRGRTTWQALLTLTFALALQACSKAPAPAPVATAAAAAAAVAWVKPAGADIEPIFAQARANHQAVFLYWGAVWCPPCNQVKATVFNRPDFIARSKQFVPVYLDGDTAGAQKLGTRFKVRGYPTMILFNSDGNELMRIPGEVDAAKYMELLDLGLASNATIKQSLTQALSGAELTPASWRLLAYYSWDQDQAQLVPKDKLASTLAQLARACPSAQRETANRLFLRAIVARAQSKAAAPDAAASLAHLKLVLSDPVQTRESADVLINYPTELLAAAGPARSPEHSALLLDFNAALDRLHADTSLSQSDRLGAIGAKVVLAKLALPKSATLAPELVAQARQAAADAQRLSVTAHERQAIVPNAADLLSEVGLLDESDTMLKAELPTALSPYYHMLVLAANAKARGDKAGSLDWSEKAWHAAQGPATRLQWGSAHVKRLIELAPRDAARIEKAASDVLAELDATAETFYERNRRGLEKMALQLKSWDQRGQHAPTLKRLAQQLAGVCGKLSADDEARQACSGVFKSASAKT